MSDPINLYQLLNRVTAPLIRRLTEAAQATCAPLDALDQWFGTDLHGACLANTTVTRTPAVDGYKDAIVATAVTGMGRAVHLECRGQADASLQCRLFETVPRPRVRILTAGYGGCGEGTLERPPDADPLEHEIGSFDVTSDTYPLDTPAHDTPATWDAGPDTAADGATEEPDAPPFDATTPDVHTPDADEPDAEPDAGPAPDAVEPADIAPEDVADDIAPPLDTEPDLDTIEPLDVAPDAAPEVEEDAPPPLDASPEVAETEAPDAFTPDDPGMTPVDAEPTPDTATEDIEEPDTAPPPPVIPGVALCTNADENEGIANAAESFFATQCLYMEELITHPDTPLAVAAPFAVETFTVTDQGAIQIHFAGDPETPEKSHPTNLVGKTITVYPPVTDPADPAYVFEKDPAILGGIYLWGHYDVPNYDTLPPEVQLALEPTVRLTIDASAGIMRVTTYQVVGAALLQETYYWPCFWDSAMSELGTDLKQCVSAEVAP